MVLIPPDAGIRMRMQTEANLLQPLHPAHEIPSDLPELRPGQRFSAQLQEVLPDNTYRALVAGKQITLQLPEGAKAGDQLQLVVLDRTAKTLIARQVTGESGASAPDEPVAYEFAKFSPAARMIGQLLPSEGESLVPAQLNRGEPLLPTPPNSPNSAAQLAPTLAKAVSQSGLFYESHQAQWVTGQRPLEQVLQEPQGQRSAPSAFQHAVAEAMSKSMLNQERAVAPNTLLQALLTANEKVGAGGTASANPSPPNLQAAHDVPDDLPSAFQHAVAEVTAKSTPNRERAITPSTILQTLQTANEKVGAGGAASANPSAPPPPAGQSVPDDLRPLVQQQLEAVSTNRLFWHGEVWPQQTMDWAIELENERQGDGTNENEQRWNTSLSLTTPRLGRIDAMLQLNAAGVRIVLATPYGATAADLRDEVPKLAQALELAGVPLLNLQVKHEDEQPAG